MDLLKVAGSAVVLLFATVAPLQVQSAPGRPAAEHEATGTGTLKVWNRPIAEFRVPVRQVRPVDRAANAARRIRTLPNDVRPEAIRAEPATFGDLRGMIVFAGPEVLFTIVDGDLDLTAGGTAMLLAALWAVRRSAEPAPAVLQRALTDFGVRYEVRAHIEAPAARFRVLSDLHAQIQDAFNEFGVQIMVPAFESQPERSVVVPKSRWFTAPAASANESSKDSA